MVGESGSGKTQLFLAAMGLLPRSAQVSGRIQFAGDDLLGADREAVRRLRGSKLTMIFQDPMTSLTPHLTIGTQLAEVLVTHRGASWQDARIAAGRMLERVRVPEPQRRLNQHPHELSGGMRQRVMLGMSLLCEPALLIADEPTTALDVTIQAEIIDLLRAVRREFGVAIALISHDLAVVASLADRIYVMYAGSVVEHAAAQELFRHPRHPYPAQLLNCIPVLVRAAARALADHRRTAAAAGREARGLSVRAALSARRGALQKRAADAAGLGPRATWPAIFR